MNRLARGIHLGAIWLFTACAVVQVFLAGLGVFVGADRFALHRDFGYTFSLLLVVVLVAAIVGRLGRRQIGFTVLLMVLFAVQSLLVGFRTSAPEVAALHPVNGFLIIAVAFVSAREAWIAWQGERQRVGGVAPVEEPGAAGIG